jgi:hypothetical protein
MLFVATLRRHNSLFFLHPYLEVADVLSGLCIEARQLATHEPRASAPTGEARPGRGSGLPRGLNVSSPPLLLPSVRAAFITKSDCD